MNKLFLVISCALMSVLVNAQEVVSFEQLRAMVDAVEPVEIDRHINLTWAEPGTQGRYLKITEDLWIEGFVITQPGHRNIDLGYQQHFTHASTSPSTRACYIESVDGKYGLRLNFVASGIFGKLKRYHLAKVNLKGTTLCREANYYSVWGLRKESIGNVSERLPEDLPVKMRTIDELTDEDLFTYVTIKDCEFTFKDGSYINVYEKYTCVPGAGVKGATPNATMDGWASVMNDSKGNQLYFMMATATEWRRSGQGVPQGKGEISGILVDTYMPRYGKIHAYGIRAQTEAEIKMAWDGESSYKTIAEWNWNDGEDIFNTNIGKIRCSELTGQDILADIGEGKLYTDVPHVRLRRANDFNNPTVYSPKAYNADNSLRGDWGIVKRGSLHIETQGKNWWNWEYDCGNSVILDISTKGLSGDNMYVAFTFSCASHVAEYSMWYPSFWCVEYSVDGQSYEKVNIPDITLRSVPWWYMYKNLKDDQYATSNEAGLGMTEHLVNLPKQLLGQERVFIRISPSRKVVSGLADFQQEKGVLTKSLKGTAVVCFGSIKVAYN